MGDYGTDFVHFISVESRLAKLQRRTIDSVDRLDFSLASRLDSTPSSNDRLDRSTRSIAGSTVNLAHKMTDRTTDKRQR